MLGRQLLPAVVTEKAGLSEQLTEGASSEGGGGRGGDGSKASDRRQDIDLS